MGQKRTLALLLAVTLVSAAGLAAAGPAIMPRSIWGGDNPGQGLEHANMPDAARENNRAGPNHEDNRGGLHTGNDNDDEDENETGDDDEESGDDGNETGEDEGDDEAGEDEEGEDGGDDEDENETGEEEEHEEDTDSLAVMHALSVIQPMSVNNTDGNWSRNWTHGNVSCSGSGNKTSGTITCSWPDYTFSFWGLNCSISAGSFTKAWSPGNVTWNWTGGDVACTWSWPSHSSGSSSGSSSTAQADRSGTSG